MLEHSEFVRIYVIDHILHKVISQMNSNTSYPTKWFTYLTNVELFQSLVDVQRYIFSYYRI